MYTFRVGETFTAAPLNLVSGISDMELVEQGGKLILYTATRAGGGLMALDVGQAMVLVDQEMLAPGTSLPAEARLELLTISGTPRLIATGPNAAGVQAFGLDAGGGLGAALQLPGSLTGTIATHAVVQVGGATYFYAARMGESTIHGYSVAANGAMTALAPRVLDGGLSGVDISAMTTVTIGGQTHLFSLSLESDMIRSFPIGPDGTLGQAQILGGPQGLPVAEPSAVQVVEMAGATYLIVAATGSSSISVVEVGIGGEMRVADHVVDTQDTQFANVQALTTVSQGDRVFVIAGGSDGGLSLMTLMPDGRLVLVGNQLQEPGLALDNITAISAHVVDGRIDIFVASEGTGITRLSVDLGPFTPIQTASPEDAVLVGTTGGDMLLGDEGNDLIQGNAGADLLADGAGSDTLSGGAGADVYVLAADGAVDVITDFQLGLDRIDLSAWGSIHALSPLSITSTATGALITYGDEVLELVAPNGLPIAPSSFRLTDFTGLWHAPIFDDLTGAIFGSAQADLLFGTSGNDVFVATSGADTIDGGDGFDMLDLSEATTNQRASLQPGIKPSGLASGQTYLNLEGIVGSRFKDDLFGDAAANILDGREGKDRLTGGGGDDSLFGEIEFARQSKRLCLGDAKTSEHVVELAGHGQRRRCHDDGRSRADHGVAHQIGHLDRRRAERDAAAAGFEIVHKSRVVGAEQHGDIRARR